jgi:hypothetical protein
VKCDTCGMDPDESTGVGCACSTLLLLCNCGQFVPIGRPHNHDVREKDFRK